LKGRFAQGIRFRIYFTLNPIKTQAGPTRNPSNT
jgi:hypothetical protein